MESYFKAAVCDLDKLLDEFEQSTTDEYDCYRPPQSPYDSKHLSLSSVLDCLQCVYPTPKQQEDAKSCTSSKEISLAGSIETSEELLNYSQQNEKSIAGPDLLSTVDSGSLSEIQASNLGRCSIPVCDLVNDTGNLVHSAHEDAQKLQPDDFQHREGLICFGTSSIPVPTCVLSAGCSSVSRTEQSDGDSMFKDSGHLKTEEINHLALKSDSYTTTEISGPCHDQHRTELVKCSGQSDQHEQTACLNTPCTPVISQGQNLDVYGPKDEKSYKKLPCEPQDESACFAASKEMDGRSAIGKVDSKVENNVESMPSNLTKRPQLPESHTALPGSSVLPGSSCQTGAEVELDEKITEENVGNKELHSNEIPNTVSSSVEDVQTSLSCLPLPVSLCGSLIAMEEKVNPLPQKEMAEVVSNILTVHTVKSSTDLSIRESCEITEFHEQEGYVVRVDERIVEESRAGEKYGTENVTDDSDSQQIKAFASGFLEYEAQPYGVHIDSDCNGDMSLVMADFTVEENLIKSDSLISDAELDAFLYGQSLQPNELKSSDNDSVLLEADADERNLTNVNNLDFTQVTEEHTQAKLDKITSVNNNLKVSLNANESDSAAEETVSHIQDMTERGSEALVSNVHSEGARQKWLLGLSPGAVGQRQLNRTGVLEGENQETSSLIPEAPISGTSIKIGKNSDPVCSRESSSEAGENQTSKNAVSPKIPATLSWKQPLWVPDSEAPNCMNCQVKFTFTKRRHHCRACGKVFCGGCCKQKCKLQFMEKEARVCTGCYGHIKARTFEKMSSTDPDPNITNSCEPSATDSPTKEAQASDVSAATSSPMLGLRQPNIKELSPREERRVNFVNHLPSAKIEDVRRLSPTAQGLSPNAAKPEADDVSTNVNREPVEEVNLITRMEELQSSFSSDDAQQAIAGPVKEAHKYAFDTLETREYSPTAEAVSTSYSSVPQAAGVTSPRPSRYRQLCGVENCVSKAISLVPDGDQLPPLLLAVGEKGRDPLVEEQPSRQQVIFLLAEGSPYPVTFILNANLLVNVKLVTYCSKKCWYFSTTGLHGLGQAEIIILLQCLPKEEIFPDEMLKLFIDIYKDAMNGKLIKNMGNITFSEKFLGTEDWGGFLFVSPTCQKFDDQILPDKPYLCGILIHKLEIPWLKAFPNRLMSSLGAEFETDEKAMKSKLTAVDCLTLVVTGGKFEEKRHSFKEVDGDHGTWTTRDCVETQPPCAHPVPLLSVRERKPMFTEIGCTIFQVLADFTNDQYTVDTIDNLFVHLEDDRCCIKIPLRKYNEVMKVIDSSDEHVIIIGANPSNEADSYLVCVQDEDGLYQTKTVSVTGCPRRVTSANFVVLKEETSPSRLPAKYTTIEDGIIVHVTTEILQNLREALRDKRDYKIICSKMDTGKVKKCVDVCWVKDEDQTNKRILSPVDGLPMEGTLSEKMFQDRNFEGTGKALNCTEVYYFVNNYELTNPVLRLFAEEIAAGSSSALCPHISSLKDSGMNKIGIRVSVTADTVEYVAGSECCLLPQSYLNELDSTLVPVIHSRMLDPESLPLKLELLFFIVEHLH